MAQSFVEINYNSKDGFTLHVRPKDLDLIPEPTLKHARKAGKEILLAMRSIVEQAIERVDEPREGNSPKRRKIKIES